MAQNKHSTPKEKKGGPSKSSATTKKIPARKSVLPKYEGPKLPPKPTKKD